MQEFAYFHSWHKIIERKKSKEEINVTSKHRTPIEGLTEPKTIHMFLSGMYF
jgi:hypothetical protein